MNTLNDVSDSWHLLQYWSGNYWDKLKDIILPFPFRPFFTHKALGKRLSKAWRRRDQPALQAKITGLMIFTSRNVGFFPFQFRI